MNKKRILLVDDEISFTRLLKLNLEPERGTRPIAIERPKPPAD
jgi:hypothetical protein